MATPAMAFPRAPDHVPTIRVTSSSPTLQHYVPRFLLRRFGVGKKDHVWVYDKQTDRVFQASTGRVAAERGLYDFEFQGVLMTMEPGLADLEAKAATATKRLVEARSLSVLTPDDRNVIATFLAVQLVRTKATRAQFGHIGAMLAGWLRESVADDWNGAAEVESFIGIRSEADEQLHYAGLLHQAPPDLIPLLLAKVWTLAETTRQYPFLIGDHPFAMSNNVDHGPRGSLGLAVRGIELYLPLSPELQLCLYCPTLVEELETEHRLVAWRVGQLGIEHEGVSQAEAMLDCFGTGRPHRVRPENVDYCNSLQIVHAERYVIASNPEFDMVRDMIKEDPAVRHGRRSARAS